MKHIILVIISLIFSATTFAIDEYSFQCDVNGVSVQSIAGLKKAPENPVVGLNIKVLKSEVSLYLIQASFDQSTKTLFATDWVSPTLLSPEGEDLLSLLALFYGIKTDDLLGLRAGLPSDLLDGFAYLELKHADQSITKLAFEGVDPYVCN